MVVLKNVVACGICCDICGLHEKLGCVYNSGVEEIAKEKVETHCAGKGVLCLVLGYAVKRGVAYWMRDCEEFPVEKYFEWCFPYGKDYLEMHINRAKDKQSKKK